MLTQNDKFFPINSRQSAKETNKQGVRERDTHRETERETGPALCSQNDGKGAQEDRKVGDNTPIPA